MLNYLNSSSILTFPILNFEFWSLPARRFYSLYSFMKARQAGNLFVIWDLFFVI